MIRSRLIFWTSQFQRIFQLMQSKPLSLGKLAAANFRPAVCVPSGGLSSLTPPRCPSDRTPGSFPQDDTEKARKLQMVSATCQRSDLWGHGGLQEAHVVPSVPWEPRLQRARECQDLGTSPNLPFTGSIAFGKSLNDSEPQLSLPG